MRKLKRFVASLVPPQPEIAVSVVHMRNALLP